MRSCCKSFPAFGTSILASAFVLAALPVAHAAPQESHPKSPAAAVPKHDLSGVWQVQGNIGAAPIAPDDLLVPKMTPWAKARFNGEKPGYGARGAPGGNDPILQCDPIGFPRIMMMPTPLEFVQAPGKILQFWEREHEWRPIWTDGRKLPEDPDPTWFGYAVGHWVDDRTLVVESIGFNDKAWLSPTGFPHSEQMRVTERYTRVDHDTIAYDLTITDPTAYSRPIVTPHRIMKLKTGVEIPESICVWSEENEFTQRIRNPATPKPAK